MPHPCQVFKVGLDRALSTLVWLKMLMVFGGFFPSKPFCVLLKGGSGIGWAGGESEGVAGGGGSAMGSGAGSGLCQRDLPWGSWAVTIAGEPAR